MGIYVCRSLDTTAKFETDAWIERILIVGYPKNPTRITMNSGTLTIPGEHQTRDSLSLSR